MEKSTLTVGEFREKLKIKTAAFIFSWDNMASKGRMSGNFNYYLVWSNLMKKELLHFYESIYENQVQIVGTPQFEPYVLERYKMSEDEFHKKFDLNPALKTICYSCGDISTSKNDELYIELIANFIKNKQLTEFVNFLVRTSPAEDGAKRFHKLKQNFEFIKWNFPNWELARKEHQEIWTQRIPTAEDVKDLRAILSFSFLNINVVSTMTIDFMLFDKPVIYPVFGNKDNGLYNDQRFLSYAHLVNVVNTKATFICKKENELLEAINCILEDPNQKKSQQKQLLEMQIGAPLEGTSERIATFLHQWS